ncbi:MAG TPA: response regulator [Candidatus Wallbacteria bacterium]|nr:response regulator [Candidatus Wallbacteria bacterium]
MLKKVFICEDEPAIAKLIKLRLNADGFKDITLFDKGEKLCEHIKNEMPDLLLLDVMIPGIDGMTILKTLKGDDGSKHVKVIMLTALSKEADIVKCLDMGADDYITKPFSPAELSSRVKKILR